MKKKYLKLTSVLLAILMTAALCVALPASAAEKTPFTLRVESNLFPSTRMYYNDLSALADENGDVFLTVEYKLMGANKYLINLDVDELAWDKQVLEFKEAYNTMGTGRRMRFVMFPFAYEQGLGTGMTNTFGDTNEGRAVGNYTSVSPAAYAYEEDGAAITVVRARFKVLNLNAGSTTVSLRMDTLSLCDDDMAEPRSQYSIVNACEVNEANRGLAVYSSFVSPVQAGDVDLDGAITVNDATCIQCYLAEQGCGADFTDPRVIAQIDFNGDGKNNVRDVTGIQRLLADYL